jgi:hypothetical protein
MREAHPLVPNLTALETLLTIICESGGARFLRVERVKGRPALVLFCAAKVRNESPTPIALPITELSTFSIRECLLALEEPRPDKHAEGR